MQHGSKLGTHELEPCTSREILVAFVPLCSALERLYKQVESDVGRRLVALAQVAKNDFALWEGRGRGRVSQRPNIGIGEGKTETVGDGPALSQPGLVRTHSHLI